ncbi:hypothetical protein ACFOEY_12795 [Paracandidimonas soli]
MNSTRNAMVSIDPQAVGTIQRGYLEFEALIFGRYARVSIPYIVG